LLEIHAAWLPFASRARSDHEIIFSGKNWSDKFIHNLRAIASVAVEKHDDIALGRKSANSSSAGAPIAAPWFSDDFGPRSVRAFSGLIGAPVIYDDDLTRNFCGGDRSNDVRDRFFFVQGGNNNIYHALIGAP
jgi:hypothetical protein